MISSLPTQTTHQTHLSIFSPPLKKSSIFFASPQKKEPPLQKENYKLDLAKNIISGVGWIRTEYLASQIIVATLLKQGEGR